MRSGRRPSFIVRWMAALGRIVHVVNAHINAPLLVEFQPRTSANIIIRHLGRALRTASAFISSSSLVLAVVTTATASCSSLSTLGLQRWLRSLPPPSPLQSQQLHSPPTRRWKQPLSNQLWPLCHPKPLSRAVSIGHWTGQSYHALDFSCSGHGGQPLTHSLAPPHRLQPKTRPLTYSVCTEPTAHCCFALLSIGWIRFSVLWVLMVALLMIFNVVRQRKHFQFHQTLKFQKVNTTPHRAPATSSSRAADDILLHSGEAACEEQQEEEAE